MTRGDRRNGTQFMVFEFILSCSTTFWGVKKVIFKTVKLTLISRKNRNIKIFSFIHHVPPYFRSRKNCLKHFLMAINNMAIQCENF
jgi:hypothetical protein